MAKKSKQFDANLAYSTNPTPEQAQRRRLVNAPFPQMARIIPGKSWAGCYIRDEIGEAVHKDRARRSYPLDDPDAFDADSSPVLPGHRQGAR